MAILVDTSILVRLANRADVSYPVADRAVVELHRRGEVLHLTPQNLVEFRNVATRPVAVNGPGLTAAAADTKIADFEGCSDCCRKRRTSTRRGRPWSLRQGSSASRSMTPAWWQSATSNG